MKKKYLITSALPYANGPLHFGHIAGAYLPGDCCARFQRLQGNDVLYVCGSDEYGVAITLSAELAKRTPQEHVNLYHGVIQDFFKTLNLSFDHYSRTTTPFHKKPVQQFFLDLLNNGYIEERVTDQLYSEQDKRFLADRYVVGTCPSCGFDNARGDECQSCGASYEATELRNPRSKITNAPLTLKPANHWFLLLEKFRDRLNAFICAKNWKPNVVNFVKNYIEGLRARAITRDSDWGVPLPLEGTDGKVLYVWFDAPIGYISSAMEWADSIGQPDKWKEYWCDEKTTLIHFIGKDNIPFHSVIFPAMTMGQNQPYKLVDELPANEFYKLEGKQFSKSDGWYIDLETFFQSYTADQIRYAIAANAPETSDAEFTWKDFQNKCNADLLGKYGNLVNRTLVFAQKQCEGKVPSSTPDQDDRTFLSQIAAQADEIALAYEQFSLRKASRGLMELAQLGNAYFDAKKPWALAKAPATRHQMETTIACCIECLKALAVVSYPIIPETADKVWRLLGFKDSIAQHTWKEILETPVKMGTVLPQPHILFTKIEDEAIEQEIAKLHTKTEPSHATIDDFQKIELKVGKIISAEPIPKSEKLLKLRVDIGNETRQIVSGIRLHYSPENLVGKHVIVVANLKPAKLMGVESHGMILAGSDDKILEVLTVEKLEPGTTVS